MWMPDSPLSGLCYLSLDRRILVSDLRLARTLLLDLVHFPYPLAYSVGIVERDARTPRKGDSTSGVAGRSHYTGLYAPMMPGSGIDFLHGPVTHRPLVILAPYGDALIPCSPEHYRLMSHRPEEVGCEDLELGSAHGTDCLEAEGELPGSRGRRPAPQMPGHERNGNDAPYKKDPTSQPLETLGQLHGAVRHEPQQQHVHEGSTAQDPIQFPA